MMLDNPKSAASAHSCDVAVIGAGAVGMSIAYGLMRLGQRVCVVDEGDLGFHASRGNFGLVWVQGKGARNRAYGNWTLDAASQWTEFATALREETGIDVGLRNDGGLTICLNDGELQTRIELLEAMKRLVGNRFTFEVLTPAQTRDRLPAVSSNIAGAVFCPLDGHVSPLLLLRALFDAYTRRGGTWLTGKSVTSIDRQASGGYVVRVGQAFVSAQKVVLAAGLGNRTLGAMMDLDVPVRPVRGQILITERAAPFLQYPTLHVRQTTDGSVQIGDSKEEVGFDDGTSLIELSRIADRASRCFPCLSGINVVRTWGALRVMSQDGYPLYAESTPDPDLSIPTCHSGITLAPVHAGLVAQWIAGGTSPPELSDFSLARFHVQAN